MSKITTEMEGSKICFSVILIGMTFSSVVSKPMEFLTNGNQVPGTLSSATAPMSGIMHNAVNPQQLSQQNLMTHGAGLPGVGAHEGMASTMLGTSKALNNNGITLMRQNGNLINDMNQKLLPGPLAKGAAMSNQFMDGMLQKTGSMSDAGFDKTMRLFNGGNSNPLSSLFGGNSNNGGLFSFGQQKPQGQIMQLPAGQLIKLPTGETIQLQPGQSLTLPTGQTLASLPGASQLGSLTAPAQLGSLPGASQLGSLTAPPTTLGSLTAPAQLGSQPGASQLGGIKSPAAINPTDPLNAISASALPPPIQTNISV